MSAYHFIEFRWTEKAVERLTELWCKEGASSSQCARILSNEFGGWVTRNSVIGKTNRLHLKQAEKPALKKPRPVVKDFLTTEPYGNPGKLEAKAARPQEKHITAKTILDAVPWVSRQESFADNPATDLNFSIPAGFDDRIQLIDLRETTCRWPIGDPLTPEFRFCGSFAPIGRPYCNHHHRIAYVASAPVKRRKRGDHHGMRSVQIPSF